MRRRGGSFARLLSLAVAAMVAACSHGPPPPPPPRTARLSLPYEVTRFANGLQLLVAPDPASKVVHVAVRYRVGSAADPEGKAGLARLVERLTFAARPRSASIGSMLHGSSVAHGSSTDPDGTYYWAAAPADKVDELLAIEAQRLGTTCEAIGDEAFARELAAARNELRFRAPDAEESRLALMEAVYGLRHPLRRPSSGYDRELAALTRADACAFLADHYGADRAVVVVTGPVEQARVERRVAQLFGAARQAKRRVLAAPPAASGHRVEVRTDVDTPTLLAAWPLPRSGRERVAAAVALRMIAGLVQGTYLGGDVQYRTSVEYLGGIESPLGVVVVRLIHDRATLDSAVDAVSGAARQLGARAGTLGGFQSAKLREQLVAMIALDSAPARARAYAEALQRGDRGRLILDRLIDVNRLGKEEVRAALRGVLHPDRMIAVLQRPAPASPEAGNPVPPGKGDASAVDPEDANRPVSLATPAARVARARRLVLENGLEVILLSSSSLPVFSLRLVLRAGYADDAAGGATALAAVHGLGVWGDYYRAGALFFGGGGQSWTRMGSGYSMFAVEGLATWSDAAIQFLGTLIVDGEYRDSSLRGIRRYFAESSLLRWAGLEQAIAETAWGRGTPNARVVGPDDRFVYLGAAEGFRERHFTAERATLIATGSFDVDNAIAQIRHAFAGMPHGGRVTGPDRDGTLAPPGAGPRFRAIPTDSAAGSSLVEVVFAVPVPRDTDPAAVLVLEQLLDDVARRAPTQLASSRTNGSFLNRDAGGSILGIKAVVSGDRVESAVRLIQERVAWLRGESPDLAPAFVLARRKALATLLMEPSQARATAELLVYAAGHGHLSGDLSAHLDPARKVAALTLSSFRPVAASLLRPERHAVVLRGPRTTVDAALAGLKLANSVRSTAR